MTRLPFPPYYSLPWFWNPDLPRQHPGGPYGFPPNPCVPLALMLVEAVNTKQVAATMAEGELRTQLEQSANETITRVIDEWCGTQPPAPPWPNPPGPTLGAELASLLASMANTMAAASVRQELLSIAGRALERSVRETAAE